MGQYSHRSSRLGAVAPGVDKSERTRAAPGTNEPEARAVVRSERTRGPQDSLLFGVQRRRTRRLARNGPTAVSYLGRRPCGAGLAGAFGSTTQIEVIGVESPLAKRLPPGASRRPASNARVIAACPREGASAAADCRCGLDDPIDRPRRALWRTCSRRQLRLGRVFSSGSPNRDPGAGAPALRRHSDGTGEPSECFEPRGRYSTFSSLIALIG
jgi:hypothetical protein